MKTFLDSIGNIQHPTSNIQHPVRARTDAIGCSMLDVRCWMFSLGFALSLLLCPTPSLAQPKPKTSGDYATDLSVVRDAQAQALTQAKALLKQTENARARAVLESTIKDMERSQAALEDAADSPSKLPA